MKAKLYNQEGEIVGEIKLPEEIFNQPFSDGLLKQVIYVRLRSQHHNKAHTKTRGEVRGGGRKPWRQKGTGRARHGSIRSPIWKGGGVVFGPRVTEASVKKINKKALRKALLMLLSRKLKDGEIIFVKSLTLDKPKTKEAFQLLTKLLKIFNGNNLDSSQKESAAPAKDLKPKSKFKKLPLTLLVLPQKEADVRLAFRNIPRVKYRPANQLDVLTIIKSSRIIIDADSIEVIKKTYGG